MPMFSTLLAIRVDEYHKYVWYNGVGVLPLVFSGLIVIGAVNMIGVLSDLLLPMIVIASHLVSC